MKFIIGKGLEVCDVNVRLFFSEDLESTTNVILSDLFKKEIFKAKIGEVFSDIFKETDKIVYLGLGKRGDLDFEGIRLASFKLGKELNRIKAEKVMMSLPKFDGLCYDATVQAICEGLINSEYSFEKFLSKKKTILSVKEFYLDVEEDSISSISEKITETCNIMEGVFFARDLVNEPAMYMTPSVLALKAKDTLTPLGVKVEILGKKEIEKFDMKAFLAVAQGSTEKPKFIIMRWEGDPSSKEKTVLVGKGLTYDSGGYCIKTAAGMFTMKCDMGGSAGVIGSMLSLAKNKVKANVVGIVASCENMISGDAYKTGDIIGSMAGKTIEVVNTDAEGRLTLADALYYAATIEKPNRIIDMATLTGAVIAALSYVYTGAVTNDQDFMDKVIAAGEKTGDLVWQLPACDKYRDMVKGDFADLKNSGVPGAGTITAGLFLEYFVENIPWVHLDIAGTAFIDKPDGYLPKGATGAPVRLIHELFKNESKSSEECCGS